ncbi:MAG TPA: Stp1/IreP family PP2C-type Ser/Thr phosphatase [Kofleriaceae bacterium]|jgi:protein phosphatase|nr:Stp1/IreP family PP2C-type Ser/Thr phosphatase [Kofleriaceae bacterium]
MSGKSNGALRLQYAARTDVGMRRNHNEDCFGILEDERLLLVADGMGGHAAGEVASGIATTEVSAFYQRTLSGSYTSEPWPYEPNPQLSNLENRLVCAFKVANLRIFETARGDGGRRGMGTTLAAAAIENGQICIAHVGDSRVYKIHGDEITRLTRDHSLLEQFKEINPGMTREEENNFPHKNVITRALGLNDEVEVEVKRMDLQVGDEFLLCSDGLSGHVTDEEMLEIVRESEDDLPLAVAKLVDMANDAGGNDNITVVLVRCSNR